MDKEKDQFLIQGFGGKNSKKQSVRYPVEQPDGVNSTDFPRHDPLTGYPGEVSLTQIRVWDLISEGEIDGLVTGEYKYTSSLGSLGYDSVSFTPYNIPSSASVRWLRSVYWNEVPVVNSQDQYNFQSINVAFTPGLPNGSLIGQVTNELTVSRAIGERLRYGSQFAKTYRLLNKEIKAFEINVRFSQLVLTDTNPSTYGDSKETSVTYSIFHRPLYNTPGKTAPSYPDGAVEIVRGKVTQGYIRKTRINLNSNVVASEPDFLGWEIMIRRDSFDSTTSSVRDQTFVDSITEIFGDVFTYPNSAIVSAQFSAEYFSQIPTRAYDVKLLKVKIPSNYDPITKQYVGDWDGTFAAEKQWTDNPAWCFYDLITNKRYGLGRYISEDFIDKWSLYQIAQYCDVMVPDGEGGYEPRFTCNLIFNSREEAYKVINDMASIFRAMTYYFAGSITAVQDVYKDSVYQFTNANVEDGNFTYSSSSKRVRNTVAIVRYNDKTNFYKPAIEYVEDFDGIRKYGIREVEITAFGCTNRGQALRLGKWALASETLETETASFVGGIEAAYLRPGDIIQIQDNNRNAQRFGGRVTQVISSSELLVDSAITGLVPTEFYNFSLLTPSFNYETTQVDISDTSNVQNIRRSFIQTLPFSGGALTPITGDDGIVRGRISFDSSFDTTNYSLTGNMVWTAEATGTLAISQDLNFYRVIRIEEQDGFKFNVSALQYESGKFNIIESGVNFEQPGYNTSSPNGPASLQLELRPISENTKKIHYTFTCPDMRGVIGFRVYVKSSPFLTTDFTDSTYLLTTLPTSQLYGDYYPSHDDTYYFRVYSINRLGIKSTTYAQNSISVDGILGLKDIIVGGLVLEEEDTDSTSGGSKKTSSATDANPNFKWQLGLQTNGVLPTGYYYRFTVREPSNGNVPSKNIYFAKNDLLYNQRENLRYQFSLNDNIHSVASISATHGPFRNYDVVVEVVDTDGNSSAGGNYLSNGDSDFSNPEGYDILYTENPTVEAVILSDGTTATDVWSTEQWINPEGEIKVKFNKQHFPTDVAGGYAYYSTESFNRPEALNQVATTKTINKFYIEESGNPLMIHANLTGVSKAYLSLSFFDVFDAAMLATGVAIEPTLNMSNVVLISKRSDINGYRNSFFAAWTEHIINQNGTIASNWDKTSFGISNISISSEGNVTITFATPFTNTNYVVFGFNDNFSQYIPLNSTITKTTTAFSYSSLSANYGKTMFFGVLYNDVANQ